MNHVLQKPELISSNGKVIRRAETAEVVLEPPQYYQTNKKNVSCLYFHWWQNCVTEVSLCAFCVVKVGIFGDRG